MIKKGYEYELLINDLGHGGEGVGRIDNLAVFIPGALPGEKVRVRINLVKKSYARAELLQILESSPHRVEAPCGVYERCGGCQLQHLDYQEQLKHKAKVVENALKRIGGLDVAVKSIIGMDSPLYYRNKVQAPVGMENGRPILGCYAQKTHEIVGYDECLIQSPLNNKIISRIGELISIHGISVYNEKTNGGDLRHVVVRSINDQAYVVLVTRRRKVHHLDKLAVQLSQEIPQIQGIAQNINPHVTNVIFGDETNKLRGKEHLLVQIGNFKLQVSPRAFLQVNWEQMQVLYDQIAKYGKLTGQENVVDAYCGIGTIGLYLSPLAKHVYGIEEVPQAIADAKLNARLNNADATFITGLVEQELPRLVQEIPIDLLVLDPPRKGCHDQVIQAIRQVGIPRIIYVSCNPATLARDLQYLKEDYVIEAVQPVDMFPHTSHVECVVVLDR